MNSEISGKFWLAAAFLLIVIIIAGAAVIWTRRDRATPIAILPPEPIRFSGQILVEGAVADPGIYPIQAGDSLDRILQTSGGTTDQADFSRLRLVIPAIDEVEQAQKVDINKAGAWMLQVLPDIGAVRAEAIVNYRQQNGPFNAISELSRVPGISGTTYEKIKDLITISN